MLSVWPQIDGGGTHGSWPQTGCRPGVATRITKPDEMASRAARSSKSGNRGAGLARGLVASLLLVASESVRGLNEGILGPNHSNTNLYIYIYMEIQSLYYIGSWSLRARMVGSP